MSLHIRPPAGDLSSAGAASHGLPVPFMCKIPRQGDRSEFCASHNGSHARKFVHFALAAIGWLTYCRTLSTFHIKALACCLLWGPGSGAFLPLNIIYTKQMCCRRISPPSCQILTCCLMPTFSGKGLFFSYDWIQGNILFPLEIWLTSVAQAKNWVLILGTTLVFATLCKEQNNPLSTNGDFSCFLGVASQGRSVKLWHASGAYLVLLLLLFHPIQHKEGMTCVQV